MPKPSGGRINLAAGAQLRKGGRRLNLTMRRFTLPVLLVLLLAVAGFSVSQMDDLKKLRQNLSGLDKEREALRKQLWDLQKLNRELAARTDRGGPVPNGSPGSGGPTPAEGPGAGNAAAGRGRLDGGRFAAAFSNPETQHLMAIQQKAALDGRYAALFKQLNLSPADLEKFKNLLVEKQSALMDVMAAARAEGLDPRASRDEIRTLVQNAQAEVDTSIQSSLGDAAFAQYKNYEATLPQRGVVDQLSQRLSYSTTPLTDTQSTQLISILAANTPAGQGGGNAVAGLVQTFAGGGPGGQVASMMARGSVPITDTVIAQAQGVLAPQQVTALQNLQQEQQASAQLMQQMRANFGGPRPNSTGTTTTPASKPTGPGGG